MLEAECLACGEGMVELVAADGSSYLTQALFAEAVS
jgi:hypothetical protein